MRELVSVLTNSPFSTAVVKSPLDLAPRTPCVMIAGNRLIPVSVAEVGARRGAHRSLSMTNSCSFPVEPADSAR